MRDQLLGYLLDALEPAERAAVERHLASDADLTREMAALRRRLEPLEAGRESFDPPLGLAQRTCELVVCHIETHGWIDAALEPTAPPASDDAVRPVQPQPLSAQSRWTMSDLVVAVGVFLAAALLLFPAINQSIAMARRAQCKDNLQKIGYGLARYSDANDGRFPNIATDGNFGTAGVYAVKLMDGRYVPDHVVFVCPGSPVAAQRQTFRVPTVDELRRAKGPRLIVLQREMGGAYGYTLGYLLNGQYAPLRNQGRPQFAMVADAPVSISGRVRSLNHGANGQNVLFEDGRVAYLEDCKLKESADDIYLNDQGMVAAGLSPFDSVIGPSAAQPFVVPLRAVSRPVP